MGIRETQVIGLKQEAIKFLQGNGYKRSDTPYERHETSNDPFDEPDLYRWTKKREDGKGVEMVSEIIQCSPWSSGPNIFLCLESDYGIRMFQWTEKDIDKIL